MHKEVVEEITLDNNRLIGIELARNAIDYTMYCQTDKKKQYILSRYNPIHTIEQFLKGDYGDNNTLWVVLGLETGQSLKCLKQNAGKNSLFLVIEPMEVLCRQLLECIDAEIIEDPRVNIYTGEYEEKFKADLRYIFNARGTENIRVILLEGYKGLFLKEFESAIRIIREIRSDIIVGMNTSLVYSSKFISNIIKNKKYIAKSLDISQHKDKYRGTPAIVVSAGPSLDNNIKYIKDFKGLVFVGGRTYNPVIKYGKRPDFFVSVDPTDLVVDTMGGTADTTAALIAQGPTCPPVPESNSGPQYFVDHGLYNPLLKQLLGVELPIMDCGGSVATLCLSAAYYMGCNPIVFIGQDLAYTHSKSHSDETHLTKIVKNEGLIAVPGYNGDIVYTDESLLNFLRWIEMFIMKHNDITYINATEGGAKIEGTKQMTLQEVVREYSKEVVQVIHNVEKTLDMQINEEMLLKSMNALKQLQDLLSKGIQITEHILHAYEKETNNTQKINKYTKKLIEKVDKPIKDILEKHETFRDTFEIVRRKVKDTVGIEEPLHEKTVDTSKRIILEEKITYEVTIDICKEMINAIRENING